MSRLRTYRLKNGLSQREMAEKVGVTIATISRLETGRRTASMRLVSSIVDATGGELTAADFMPPSDHPERAA